MSIKERIECIAKIECFLMLMDKDLWKLDPKTKLNYHNTLQFTLFRLNKNRPLIGKDHQVLSELQDIIMNLFKFEGFPELLKTMMEKVTCEFKEDGMRYPK